MVSTCFLVHNNNVMSSEMTGVVLSIDFNVSDSTRVSCPIGIIATFAADIDIYKRIYKQNDKSRSLVSIKG